jgi:hypothetical protein
MALQSDGAAINRRSFQPETPVEASRSPQKLFYAGRGFLLVCDFAPEKR